MNQPQASFSHRARVLGRWSLIATLLASVVIMLGAWTRLVDAGLGCPDWPGCYGFLSVPQSPESIAIANARFPDTPVEVEKGWPEMIHRYAAGILGLVVFGLAAYAVRHRREDLPVKLPLFIAGFIVLQGAFGMWTVTLKLWPQVVALHLLGGLHHHQPAHVIDPAPARPAEGHVRTGPGPPTHQPFPALAIRRPGAGGDANCPRCLDSRQLRRGGLPGSAHLSGGVVAGGDGFPNTGSILPSMWAPTIWVVS